MSEKIPTLDDVKFVTSFNNKGQLARKGCVFFVFKVKRGKFEHKFVKEVDRTGVTKEEEAEYILEAKKVVLQQVLKK